MAEKKFPYKVKHHGTGAERQVFGPADLVKAEFDGFSAGPKPKAFTKASRQAAAEKAAQANKAATRQPQDAAGDAGKSTTTPSK